MTAGLRRRIKSNGIYWLFILPILLPFTIFFIIPFIMSAAYSLYKWNGISADMTFVGVKNYVMLFTDDSDYFTSLAFTIKYVVLDVVLCNVLALGLALLLDSKIHFKNAFRTVFFAPSVVSSVIAGFLWVFIYNEGSQSLYQLTKLGIFNTDWLGGANIAIFSMIIVALWQGAGYIMVIYLAGLQSVDSSLVEAAKIDGATGFQLFRHITLPLIMPSVTVSLFMTLSQAFRTFDLNISLTNGGPGKATLSLALDIYKEGFSNNAVGYAAAKAMVLFVIVLAITMFQLWATKSREVQQ
jgi:ABC-type sugar transport systems, permease components